MEFISFERSQELLQALHVKPAGWEKIFISNALGRVLAEDITATSASPEFATSAMDGYAIKTDDQDKKHITVLADNPAGSEVTKEVSSGYCIKTFTGSKIPKGADAVIPIEYVTLEGSEIIINQRVKSGENIREIGESYNAGDILIKKGTKISFAEIGVLAGLNRVMIKVFVKPKVAVVSTGSELLDVGQQSITSTQIRSSNNYTVAAMMELGGAEVLQLGVVKDDMDSIISSFSNALDVADIVITTGGVSVGDYDFVKDIVPSLGAKVVFKGVNIKPGQHILLAQKNNKFIVALPGFAYSSTVTAWLYALPLVKKMQMQNSGLRFVWGVLGQKFNKKSKKTEFTACNVDIKEGVYVVDFKDKKVGTSAILTNLLYGSVLMVTPANGTDLQAGEKVKLILPDLSF